MPPSPPFSHTSHSSTPTLSVAHSSRTASNSASVSVTNRLSATTTGTPNFFTLRMWRRRFAAPPLNATGAAPPQLGLLHPPCRLHPRHLANPNAPPGLGAPLPPLMSEDFSP